MTCPPIVFLIFNRPTETFRVFERIREARPETLLIVADGPRTSRPGEAALCRDTRAVRDRVDWPCEVLTNFAETNMGCGRRIASGLDWAFAQVEEAIILEDDCLCDLSFFRYCGELLERYRADERIMMISGNNFQNGNSRTPDSYYFSQIPHCWGWATWRRAWRHYDYEMHDWRRAPDLGLVKARAASPALERYWRNCFDDVAAGRIDTWDYQWMYCLRRQNGLSVAPDVNLVTNIGFGSMATHTMAVDQRHVVPSRELNFPLRHPAAVQLCEEADVFEKRYLHHFPWFAPLLWRIHRELRPILHRVRTPLERAGLWAPLRALAIWLGT
jgi:hypothetical protein